jgi:hypothetical protein
VNEHVERARTWLNEPLRPRRRYHWLLGFLLGAANGAVESQRRTKVKELEKRVQMLERQLLRRRTR